MGLGGGPSEWDEYEWVRLADLALDPAAARARTLVDHLRTAMTTDPPWREGAGFRVLLVDLDNLRADPVRWRARMAAVVALARQADHVAMAGQVGAVDRAREWLDEFAPIAQPVPDGSDVADRALLEYAASVRRRKVQFVVVSNDRIFADLARRGPLAVISPGADALSDKLRDAAFRVDDLTVIEGSLDTPVAR